MYRNMAFIEMSDDTFRQGAGLFHIGQLLGNNRFLGNQHGDTGTLRIIVLVGNIQDIRTDEMTDIR